MSLEEEYHGDVVVLVMRGDLDASTLPSYEARLNRLLEIGTRYVVWDVHAVGILPSTAAGFLIQAGRRLRATGGRMALAAVPRRVRGTLHTMGVGGLFPTFATRADAVKAFAAAATEDSANER